MVLSPPCGMATLATHNHSSHSSNQLVLSPLCGMATAVFCVRIFRQSLCSKPTVWDEDLNSCDLTISAFFSVPSPPCGMEIGQAVGTAWHASFMVCSILFRAHCVGWRPVVFISEFFKFGQVLSPPCGMATNIDTAVITPRLGMF